ncbi:tetraspanin-21-like [Chrysoperla carnea]|uniref:tetraspanin-21-like n=1 Tax=Chrysoperla carnea TaxID=189513 RepID=UPI001D09558B|nr:tetraspanin-21-like [Chrysoperla carnea]
MTITETVKIMEENDFWVVQPKSISTRSIAGERNHNVNDSGDSIASVVVPRRALRLTRNTPYVIEQYRNVDAKDFFLCMCSLMLIVSAISLVGVSIWTLVIRIPYFYICEHFSYFGIVSFTMCAGLLCFPSSWLAWGAHERKSGYIPLLVVFLCVSIIMLATGTALGTVHRSRINFDWIVENSSYKSFVIKNLTIYEESRHINIHPHVQAGPYRSALNSSMVNSLLYYEQRSTIKYGWDIIQQKYRCCGVNSPNDWYKVRKNIPDSCCKKFHVYDASNNQSEFYNHINCELDNIFLDGCLDPVAYDLAHQSTVLTSMGYIVLFLELLSLLISALMYVRMRMAQQRRLPPLQPSASNASYCFSVTPRQSRYGSSIPSNIIPHPQVYYRYIQPPSNVQLQQLQHQQIQQQPQQLHQQAHTPTMSPTNSTDINYQTKGNFETDACTKLV